MRVVGGRVGADRVCGWWWRFILPVFEASCTARLSALSFQKRNEMRFGRHDTNHVVSNPAFRGVQRPNWAYIRQHVLCPWLGNLLTV